MLTFGFVGPQRRVGGHEQHVFAQLQQRGGQRVVVQTTAAVHAGGPGRDVGDAHKESRVKSRESRARNSWTPHACGLAGYTFRFHAFEPGVEVIEEAAGFGVEDAADQDVGHRADVVRILADEFADAELAAVPGFGQLADPGGAAGEIGHPFAELRAGRVAFAEAFDDGVGGELARSSGRTTRRRNRSDR